jgi:uncharacterized protein YcnI
VTGRPSDVGRRVLVAVSVVVLSLVGTAASAWADVTVTPAQATQGDAAGVTFRVTNTCRAALMSRVTIFLPEATPIGEVYPYSVPGWAARTSMRTLKPSEVSSGRRTSQVVASVEWIATPGAAPKPGQVADLSLSLNPLPAVDQLQFTVVENYSDGTVVRWGGSSAGRPGPVIALVARTIPAKGAGEPTGASPSGGQDISSDQSPLIVTSGVLVALLAAATLLWYRRRAASSRPGDAAAPGQPALDAPSDESALPSGR